MNQLYALGDNSNDLLAGAQYRTKRLPARRLFPVA